MSNLRNIMVNSFDDSCNEHPGTTRKQFHVGMQFRIIGCFLPRNFGR